MGLFDSIKRTAASKAGAYMALHYLDTIIKNETGLDISTLDGEARSQLNRYLKTRYADNSDGELTGYECAVLALGWIHTNIHFTNTGDSAAVLEAAKSMLSKHAEYIRSRVSKGVLIQIKNHNSRSTASHSPEEEFNAKRLEDQFEAKARSEQLERLNKLSDWMKQNPEPSISTEKQWRQNLASWAGCYLSHPGINYGNYLSVRKDMLEIILVSDSYPVGLKKLFGGDAQKAIETWRTLGLKYLNIEI